MQVVTWNINSLTARAGNLVSFLDRVYPDVICLQELKLAEEEIPFELFEERGYEVALHAQPRWNGVLIASLEPLDDVEVGLPDGDEGQARFVAATVGDLRLVDLYCPQGSRIGSEKFAYKLRFYEALLAWLERRDPARPLLLTGDMNIAPAARDLHDPEAFAGQVSFSPAEHAIWQRLLDWGLQDLAEPHLPPGTWTFWDYRTMGWQNKVGMRIDHFLGTASVAARVQSCHVETEERGLALASDHAPVVLDLEE